MRSEEVLNDGGIIRESVLLLPDNVEYLEKVFAYVRRIDPHQITNLEFWSPRRLGAATRKEIRKSSRRSSIN